MSGRTLREAIALALEFVPSTELAAGDEVSRAALRGYLLAWIKDYASARGVIFEDKDLEHDLVDVIAELRASSRLVLDEPDKPAVNPIEVTCTICNARPGERCSSIIDARQYLEVPHARRRELARKGEP